MLYKYKWFTLSIIYWFWGKSREETSTGTFGKPPLLMFIMGIEQRQKSIKITPQQNKQESEKQSGQQEVPSPMHRIREKLINRRNAMKADLAMQGPYQVTTSGMRFISPSSAVWAQKRSFVLFLAFPLRDLEPLVDSQPLITQVTPLRRIGS